MKKKSALQITIGDITYTIDVHTPIKAGDKVICDDRNNWSEPPIYSVQTVRSVENDWIFTNEQGSEVGSNPDWTYKVIAIN